jgi:D-alanine-D-alanine ligase
MTRLRVGVFAGGRSPEHEVSVASGEAVLRAIDRDRYEPSLVYIDREGRWMLPNGPAPRLEDGATLAGLLGAASPADEVVRMRTPDGHAQLAPVADDRLAARAAVRSLAETIDVAFLVVHGPFGEDGTLQGFLGLAGIPYVGAGVLASSVAMDKVVFKDLMRGHGLPVVDYASVSRRRWRKEPERVVEELVARIGPRSVVKPARLGSSVGMTLAHDPGELPPALEEAFRWDTKAIVEAYLAGAREFECGVLGNDDPMVFEPGEVVSHHELYDYEAKYVPGLADVVPRAEVEPALAARLRQLALAAYRAVDARGMARVDFLAVPDGTYISEMNTIPGFTATSMFPKQAELSGIRFGELVARLIALAEEEDPA